MRQVGESERGLEARDYILDCDFLWQSSSEVQLVSILFVVFLVVDVATRSTQFFVQVLALSLRESTAVGPVKSFVNSDPGLLGFKSRCFRPRQFSASNALPDSHLLSMFNSIDRRSSLLCRRHNWRSQSTHRDGNG